MTSREERDRRRAERVAAERKQAAAERRRLLLGYAVAGALSLAVVVGIVIVIASGSGDDGEAQVDGKELPELAFIKTQSGILHGYTPDGREGTPPEPLQQGDLEKAAKAAGCELELDLPEEGSTHLRNEKDAPEYKTDPPTSGDHWPEQLADGAYSEYPDPIYSVHALEHGRIQIQYSPDLPEAEQLELKGLFEEDPNAMLLFPNPDMEYDVAATAWTQKIGCPTYEGQATIDALRDFRDVYRGQGPENVPVMIAE
jgi:hypothetical protein